MIKLVVQKSRCDICHYGKDHKCGCPQDKECGTAGYFVKESKPRAGKYERLLKALLKCFTVESKLLLISGHLSMLTPKNEQQLIAIKEAMEKGVKV
jgi:hypothetical protein